MAGERFFDAKEPLPRAPFKKAVWDVPWHELKNVFSPCCNKMAVVGRNCR